MIKILQIALQVTKRNRVACSFDNHAAGHSEQSAVQDRLFLPTEDNSDVKRMALKQGWVLQWKLLVFNKIL
jgi:hypothetical protein